VRYGMRAFAEDMALQACSSAGQQSARLSAATFTVVRLYREFAAGKVRDAARCRHARIAARLFTPSVIPDRPPARLPSHRHETPMRQLSLLPLNKGSSGVCVIDATSPQAERQSAPEAGRGVTRQCCAHDTRSAAAFFFERRRLMLRDAEICRHAPCRCRRH